MWKANRHKLNKREIKLAMMMRMMMRMTMVVVMVVLLMMMMMMMLFVSSVQCLFTLCTLTLCRIMWNIILANVLRIRSAERGLLFFFVLDTERKGKPGKDINTSSKKHLCGQNSELIG